MAQSRNWVFTLNNPSDHQEPSTWPCKFAAWQLECGENGTNHLQGYVMFATNHRLEAVKKINRTAHWEIRRGTHDQALAYAQKEETRVLGPWQKGDAPAPGKRNDLLTACESLKAGTSMKRCAEENPVVFVKYHRGLTSFKRLVTPPRNFKTEVLVIYGPTGIGKSHFAREHAPDAYWLPQGKWFDDYDGQEYVIIDEFYGWLPFSYLLRLLDEYPLLVETKGGHVQFVSRKVIVTSNSPPWEWYKSEKIDYSPLKRRIEMIFTKPVRDADWAPVTWQ